MSLPVALRLLADADVQRTHAELEAQSPGLGDKFLDRLQEAFERIEAMPEMYAEVWGTVRAARLRTFRHFVYHIVRADRVEVIAVMHGSRDSSAWRSRV